LAASHTGTSLTGFIPRNLMEPSSFDDSSEYRPPFYDDETSSYGKVLSSSSLDEAPRQEYEGRGLQMDLMVPVFDRDERLRLFAEKFAQGWADYRKTNVPLITTFRLLLARYGEEEQASAPALQSELANITGLPMENIVMVYAPEGDTFSRARAMNLLHITACSSPKCLAAGLDVDMEVRKEFFSHAVQAVIMQLAPPKKSLGVIFPIGQNDRNNTFKGDIGVEKSNNTVYFPVMVRQLEIVNA